MELRFSGFVVLSKFYLLSNFPDPVHFVEVIH